nr:alanyl-trna editing protein alax-m [Quercus suber]
MATATHLVYQRYGERLVHTAKILSIIPITALTAPDQALVKDAGDIEHAVITDSTIFHVQGGGQPSDTGTMTSGAEPTKAESTFEVKFVRHPAEGGQVLHFGRFIPTNGATAHFDAAKELEQHVDPEKRNLYSRLHSGGHIMSLAIHALCHEGVIPGLTESKASHYPDSAAVTFNGTIEAKHKDAIQAKTDEYVKSARAIKIHWWPMEELLEKCYASEGFALPKGESVGRVVEMEGLGSYPCGGTHVQDCSQVGRIEVRKISRSKGTSKVSYRVA